MKAVKANAYRCVSGEAAQAIFDGDFDEIEIRQEWLPENTLHEWDEGEFQLEPPMDTEEGKRQRMNGTMTIASLNATNSPCSGPVCRSKR